MASAQGRELREAPLSVAGEQFSSLRRLAEENRDFSSDAQFEFGLGIILSGLDALLATRPTT